MGRIHYEEIYDGVNRRATTRMQCHIRHVSPCHKSGTSKSVRAPIQEARMV